MQHSLLGKGLARDFGEVENLQVSQKGPGDFVSSADHRAEKVIIRELQKVRPDWGFLVEESGEIEGKDKEYRWIVDPLDGTNNFLHGLPHFCTSIALEKKQPNGKGEIVAGVIFAPILQELYWAEKGEGAFGGGVDMMQRKLRVGGRARLQDCLVASYIHRTDPKRSEADKNALSAVGCNTRILGSAALELAYVAAGKIDAFWHRNLKPWDMAAGSLIVKEARGMATEIDGGSRYIEKNNILAANERIHELVSEKIRSIYRGMK